MTRLTITLPDHLAAAVKQVGGDNVSAWMQRAAHDALLRDEAAAVAAYETATGDPVWDAEREREYAA